MRDNFKVNYLVGCSNQFLLLLDEIQEDERVCFIPRGTQRIWMGEIKPDHVLIRTVDEDPERSEIMKRYCPLFKEVR